MILETERLRLRNWGPQDRNLFYEINRDFKVMEFFPHRRSHAECDMLLDMLQTMIAETGLGFYAVADKETDEAMGFCGLAPVELPGILPENSIEIGWRLATRFWGRGYMTEAANAALRFGFEQRGLPEIFAFAVKDNHRSIAVMKRLNMTHLTDQDFDHPKVPETHPHLKRHVLFRASKIAQIEIQTTLIEQFTQA